jgi:hypothetical protein
VHAAGIYDDQLVSTDSGWRIARRRYTMVYRSVLAGAERDPKGS